MLNALHGCDLIGDWAFTTDGKLVGWAKFKFSLLLQPQNKPNFSLAGSVSLL